MEPITEVPGDDLRSYKTTAPLVLVRCHGTFVYCFRGDPIPANADTRHVRRLLENGMIQPIGGTA